MLKEREVRIFEQKWTTSCLVTKEIIKKYMWDEQNRLRKVTITQRELRSEFLNANGYTPAQLGGNHDNNNRSAVG